MSLPRRLALLRWASRARAWVIDALVLGFAAVRPEAGRRGMERLAGAIEAALKSA